MIAKIIIRSALVLAALGVGYLCLHNDLGWGWAILLTIVSWLVFASVFVGIVYAKCARFLPIWMQRPLYEEWCKRVDAIEMDALVAYPFHIHMALENKAIFEKEGLQAAMKAAEKWLNEYPDKFGEAITTYAERFPKAEEPAKEAKKDETT